MDEINIQLKDNTGSSPQQDLKKHDALKGSENDQVPSSEASVESEGNFDQVSLGTSPAQLQMPQMFASYPVYPSSNAQIPNSVVLGPAFPLYQQHFDDLKAKRASQTSSIREKLLQKRCILAFFLIATLLILCALVVLLVVLGSVPCSFKNCSGKGVTCENAPFNCIVECKDGYKPNSDGVCISEFEPISFFSKSCNSGACDITNTFCDSFNQCNCMSGYYGDDATGVCQECGLSKQSVNLRVVGGIVANPHSWPSIGLLQFGYEKQFVNSKNRVRTASLYQICSVFLIDRRTLLTAAHCINQETSFNFYDSDDGYTHTIEITYNSDYPTFESLFTVFLGVNNLTAIKQSNPNMLIMKPKKLIRHEEYDSNIYTNDIGLIKLYNDVKLNDVIQIACLPTDTTFDIKPNASSYLAGWGLTDSSARNIPNTLYNVNLTIYEGSKFCRMYLNTNWQRQICAGDYYNEKDSCNGDSGGPLFVYDEELKKFVAVGIVSYGKRVCGAEKVPSVYTRISYYLNWIRKNQYK